MSNQKRFVAKNGVDNNNQTLINILDPVNPQDASTKAFSSNAANLLSGILPISRLPAFTGDAVVSQGTSVITLSNGGVAVGTYNSATTIMPFTVDAKGRITAIGIPITIAPAFSSITAKPTTLAGYGITDAQPLNTELTGLAGIIATSGLVKKTAAGTYSLDTNTYLTAVPAQTFASLTGKPTTLSGYGITDATPSTHLTDVGLHLTSIQNTWIDAITATAANLNSVTGLLGTAAFTAASAYATVAQTMYIGTTAVAINRASGPLILTGITSIDGNASTVTNGIYHSNNADGDFNSLLANGHYRYNAAAPNNPGFPHSNVCVIHGANTDTVGQLVIDYATGKIATRGASGIGGTPVWSGWNYTSGTNTGDQTNVTGTAGSSTKFMSTSHAGTYYTVNNWDGTYWYQTTNHGSPVRVGYSDTSNLANLASRANGNFYIDQNFGYGLVGVYDPTKYQGIFSMGSSWALAANGTTTGNLYGMSWSHPNAGGIAGNLDSHGMIVLINGGFGSCMSYSIKASGNITAYSDERLKTNWRDLPTDFVSKLANVKVGIYDRLDGEHLTQVGVSAQSLQLVMPEAIITANDNMKTLSVSYGNAALASAVELAKEIVSLKARLLSVETLLNLRT